MSTARGGALLAGGQKFVFVASSSDLDELRREIVGRVNAVLRRAVADEPILAVDWKALDAETALDQRQSYQEGLPRTSSDGCVGVVAVFGERIGSPLEWDFATDDVLDFAHWVSDERAHRLRHPWPTSVQEQLDAVERGEFPLTGPVFEVLDAMGAGVPFHIAYFADQTVRHNSDVRCDDICFGGHAWLRDKTNGWSGRRIAEFLAAEYAIQTGGLFNFLAALSERNRPIPRYAASARDEALLGIQRFVAKEIAGEAREDERNPYRFLDFYDIVDAEDLPGRADATRMATDELKARVTERTRAPLLRIDGESGCGKTSFMRAGVLAAFQPPNERAQYRVAAFRPTDFHDANGLPRDVLARVASLIDESSGLAVADAAKRKAARLSGPQGPKRLTAAICDALDDVGAEAVVLGLDQFEEIIDDIVSAPKAVGLEWRPLVNFVQMASETGRIAFVFTLESSREKALDAAALPKAFEEAHVVALGGHSDEFLTEVIDQPFREAGIPLSRPVIRALLDEYGQLVRSAGLRSMLPLLALKLWSLFELLQERFGGGVLQRRDGSAFEKATAAITASPRGEITLDDVGDDIRLDNEIEEIAEKAWRGDDVDLNNFLQPLVAISAEHDRLTLRSIPAQPNNWMQSERLRSFERSRLLIRDHGRVRIVHEIVIRRWARAAQWLHKHGRYLRAEARMRLEAMHWHDVDEDARATPSDQAAIDDAAAILCAHRQAWSVPRPDELDLEPRDDALRRYALAIFSQSDTPRREVEGDYRSKDFMGLAVGYRLKETIDRFVALDPQSLNEASSTGGTALHVAVWLDVEMVQYILDFGVVDFHQKDSDGWPVIAAAIFQENLEMFGFLLRRYTDAEQLQGPSGSNMLHFAARVGSKEMAIQLKAVAPDLDWAQRDVLGRSPFAYACSFDRAAFLRELFPGNGDFFELAEPSDQQLSYFSGFTLLHWAAQDDAANAAAWLVGQTGFEELVEARDGGGRTALMAAAEKRHFRTVEQLLSEMDPNSRASTPKPAVEVNRLFWDLNEGLGSPQETRGGWTALHFAVAGETGVNDAGAARRTRIETLRTVRALLSHDQTDPNIAGESGATPFSLARRHPAVRAALLAHPRFNATKRLPDGQTPLNYLIEHGDRSAVRRLIFENDEIDLQQTSENGDYALALLIDNGMADIALEALRAGKTDPWSVQTGQGNGFATALGQRDADLVAAYMAVLPDAPSPAAVVNATHAARWIILGNHGHEHLPPLIDLGVDRSADFGSGWTLFHTAALVGDVASFERLLDGDTGEAMRPDARGRKPLALTPDVAYEQIEALTRAGA